jgi:hypothetical protein
VVTLGLISAFFHPWLKRSSSRLALGGRVFFFYTRLWVGLCGDGGLFCYGLECVFYCG